MQPSAPLHATTEERDDARATTPARGSPIDARVRERTTARATVETCERACVRDARRALVVVARASARAKGSSVVGLVVVNRLGSIGVHY